MLKAFPEIDLAMTTVGTEDGRNYARVNLKLVDRAKRSRTQKRARGRDPRGVIKPIPGIELAIGYDRPIWFNLLGPDPDTLSRIAKDVRRPASRRSPGIADLETSDKAANPALSMRLNNDVASDLGITVQQVGSTIRPLIAGDTVELLARARRPELRGQRAAAEGRAASSPSDLGNLYI